jgi:hypothetical protein
MRSFHQLSENRHDFLLSVHLPIAHVIKHACNLIRFLLLHAHNKHFCLFREFVQMILSHEHQRTELNNAMLKTTKTYKEVNLTGLWYA